MSNGKVMIIHLWIDKKRLSVILLYKISRYFPKQYEPFGGDINVVKVDLSNYATKAGIKNISHVDP